MGIWDAYYPDGRLAGRDLVRRETDPYFAKMETGALKMAGCVNPDCKMNPPVLP